MPDENSLFPESADQQLLDDTEHDQLLSSSNWSKGFN